MELKYKTLGEGKKAVFFLHELMGDSRNYNAIIPYLNIKDFKYFFIDLRGYGLSIKLKGSYSCSEAIEDILTIIKKEKLSKVNLVGHSMSTLIAQSFAISYENYLENLILITPVLASGVKMKEEAKQKLLKDMQEDNKIEEVVLNSSKRYNQTWIDYRINIAYTSSTKEARVGYMKMYLNEDFSNEASKITVPVKAIVGKYDFVVFSKAVINKAFKSWYKNLELIEFEEAGHYPMIETPVLFASKLEEFLL
ncbi:alpha/beta fold hydrolase [Malaciobacter mytili]|uniref:alpha/beta fold hydrolase n=1 Tax=Malaciobacter mytili TaxID=603050 RepID=UPI003A8617AC